MSDLDLSQSDTSEVLDLPAPNDGEEGTLETPAVRTGIARWYAVQVASSCEKKVKATLEQRAVTLGVSNRILEIEIPETPAVKVKKDGSSVSVEVNVAAKAQFEQVYGKGILDAQGKADGGYY